MNQSLYALRLWLRGEGTGSRADVTTPIATPRSRPRRPRSRKPNSPAAAARHLPRVRPYVGTPRRSAPSASSSPRRSGSRFRRSCATCSTPRSSSTTARCSTGSPSGSCSLFALQGAMNFVQVYLLTGHVGARHRQAARGRVRASRAPVARLLHRAAHGRAHEPPLGGPRRAPDAARARGSAKLSRQLLFLVGGVVLLTLTHPQLTTTTLAVVPVVVGLGVLLRTSAASREHRACRIGSPKRWAWRTRRSRRSARCRASCARTRRRAAIGSLLSGVVDAAIARAKMRATLFGVVGFVAFAGVVAVLWQGGRLVLDGALTPGALVSFLLLRDHGRGGGRLARVAVRQLSGSDRRGAACVRAARHRADRGRAGAPRAAAHVRCAARWRSSTCASATRPSCPRCSPTCRSRSRRARSSRSSDRAAPARRRLRRSSRASGT